MSGDVFCGLHSDVCHTGLGDDVGVQAANGHQAAQVAALVVGLVVLVETHLGGRPALQVACAVDGAEALAVCCKERRGERESHSQVESSVFHKALNLVLSLLVNKSRLEKAPFSSNPDTITCYE